MNYYQFHIGDYISHTAHLEPLEDLAYRRLLDLYYSSELPIPKDLTKAARLIRLPVATVKTVLEEFFILTDDGYRNTRADQEIQIFQGFAEAGKRGAAKRWAKNTDSPPIAPLTPPYSPPNATLIATNNHKPITNNQNKNKNSTVNGTDSRFDEIRLAYPKRGGSQKWGDAERAYNARLAEGHTHEDILAGCERYGRFLTLTGKAGTEYVQMAATFLGRNKGFLELWQPPNQVQDIRQLPAHERVKLAIERNRGLNNAKVVSEQTGSGFGSLEDLMRDVRK